MKIWFKPINGIATGVKLSVYIANIAVYYAFKRIVHDKKHINLLYLFRYIDDGTGGWRGTLQEFYRWFIKVYKYLYNNFNLRLTLNICPSYNFSEFLDIQYRFINNGTLDTDVFYKPTDSHRYLNFNSCHPHMFSERLCLANFSVYAE